MVYFMVTKIVYIIYKVLQLYYLYNLMFMFSFTDPPLYSNKKLLWSSGWGTSYLMPKWCQ